MVGGVSLTFLVALPGCEATPGHRLQRLCRGSSHRNGTFAAPAGAHSISHILVSLLKSRVQVGYVLRDHAGGSRSSPEHGIHQHAGLSSKHQK